MVEYDGRYEVEIKYAVTIASRALNHNHTFDVKTPGDIDPGVAWADVELVEKSGLTVFIETFIQDYMDVWSALLGVGTALSEINLWRYDPEPSNSRVLVASADTLPTTSFVGTPQAAQGCIFTFRAIGYNFPVRMYIMEGKDAGEQRTVYGALTGVHLAYANYVKSTASPIVGRSDAYIGGAIAMNLGQNEKLRNIRYRSL